MRCSDSISRGTIYRKISEQHYIAYCTDMVTPKTAVYVIRGITRLFPFIWTNTYNNQQWGKRKWYCEAVAAATGFHWQKACTYVCLCVKYHFGRWDISLTHAYIASVSFSCADSLHRQIKQNIQNQCWKLLAALFPTKNSNFSTLMCMKQFLPSRDIPTYKIAWNSSCIQAFYIVAFIIPHMVSDERRTSIKSHLLNSGIIHYMHG